MRRSRRMTGFISAILSVLLIATLCLTACGGININSPQQQPQKESCTVVFFENGGSTVAPATVEKGGKVAKPSDPTRDGYIFGGWYKDVNFKLEWKFDTDTVIASTTVLYAKWTSVGGAVDPVDPVDPDTCVVVFVVGNGGTIPSQTVEYGKKISQPSDPARDGYTFGGWYTDSGHTSAWDFNTAVNAPSVILYAKWTPKQPQPVEPSDGDVCVTFNVGLAARKDGLSNPPAKTVKSGNKVAAPTVARAGYTLDGWYAEDGGVKWDFGSDTVSNNTTLFARWVSGGGTTIDYTPTMTNSNTLYIHYLRGGDDYENWYIYTWSDNGSIEVKNVVTIDKSGAVFALDLTSNVLSGLSTVNFIVTQPGWVKDGGDNTVTLADAQKVGGSYHWYVTEGKTASGSNKPTAAETVGGTTEPKRESRSNVDRSYAQSLPVMNTVDGWDETGVGYQIFVASFCDSDGDGCGDIQGVIKKLDYLESLNVDVLWLTPIQSSDSYHGYDCYDYYCIDSKFGTNADYRQLVYEVHKRGMKIIMDLVVNHTSTQNEWFIKSKAGVIEEVTYQDGATATVNYRDFYRWKNSGGNRYCNAGDGWYYYSSFNSSMPELNYDYQPARDAMADVAAYWMNYGLDGFRMDAIKHMFMWDESENEPDDVEGGSDDRPFNYNINKNIEFFKEFNYKLKNKYPHCFLLGEQLSGNTTYVSKFYAGMDSLFDFNTYFDLAGRLDGGAQAQANAFNSNAEKYNAERQNGRPINGMISSNHDVERLNYKTGGSVEKAKLYMAVIMTMPGLSWIYYGDEIGLVGDKNGGKGDDGLRQSMKWTDDWQYKCSKIYDYHINDSTQSVAAQESDGNSLLSYVKSLTKLRNDYPVLINGTATCSEENGMLKISVTNGSSSLTVYHNFGGSSKTVGGTPIFGTNTIPAYGTTVVR